MQFAPPKGRTGCPRGEGLSVGVFFPTDQMDTGAHIGATWSAKDTDEGRLSAGAGWGALGGGDWNLSLSRPYPLTHLSGMRRGQSKAQPRVANLFFVVCVFFFFNTLCHPPLRSLTAMRQVAALLNSKRSQRNGDPRSWAERIPYAESFLRVGLADPLLTRGSGPLRPAEPRTC